MTSRPVAVKHRRTFVVAFALLVALHCTSYTPGTEVRVRVRGNYTSGEFVSVNGGTLRNLSGYLVLSSLELLPCTGDESANSSAALRRALWSSEVARAHTNSSPTRIGVPWIISLQDLVSTHPEMFRPPPDSYCAVDIRVEPADDDALDLPDERDLVFRSLVFEAELDGVGPVSQESFESIQATVPLDPPLELTPDDQIELQLDLDVTKLFENWPVDKANSKTVPAAVIKQLPAALSLGSDSGP